MTGGARGGGAQGGRAEGGRAEGGRAEGGRAEGGRAEGGRAEGGTAEDGGAGDGGAQLCLPDRLSGGATDGAERGSPELILSGGGSVAVATDAMLVALAELRGFAAATEELRARVARVPWLIGGDWVGSGMDLALAERRLADAAARAADLAAALQRAAENYGELERRLRHLSRGAEGWVAERFGRLLPFAALSVLPLLPAIVGMLPAAAALARNPGADDGATTGVHPAAELLTDPGSVALIRSLVMGSDEFAAGVLGLPGGLAALLGENGLDLLGLPGFAAIVASLAGRAGMLRESDVRVHRFSRRAARAAPSGFRERAERVPAGGSQIRIERYRFAGAPDRFEVFLGGTRAAGVLGGDEPWDMTSNVHAVADGSAGSLRAAQAAMRDAGVTPESEVVFTGYSQGGLVAGMLASSGDYNTQGLVTFGAPAGGIDVPGGFPTVMVEHTDDLVPALGGDRADLTPLVVRREAFAGRDVPAGIAVPAHALAEYASTAALLDDARSAGITAAAERLGSFGRGADRVHVSFYRAERIPDG